MAIFGTVVPDNALSFRNLIINGDMRIAQRGTSVTGVTSDGYYTADRWDFLYASGTYTHTQESDGPSGFEKSIKIACTSSGSGTSLQVFRQRFEGQHTYFLDYGTADARPTTLSFWVKSNVVETFSLGLIQHSSIQRGSYHNYTIAAANTWQKVIVNIPGDPNGDSFSNNTMIVSLDFFLNGTSGGSTPDGSWGSRVTTNNAEGNIITSGDYWQITGVQLEAGSVATPFERRPFGTELALCQRYFFTIRGADIPIASGGMQTTTNFVGLVKYPVEMRGTPTLTASNTADHFRVFIDQSNAGNPSTVGVNIFGGGSSGFVLATLPSPVTQGLAGALRTLNANSFLNFSAEL